MHHHPRNQISVKLVKRFGCKKRLCILQLPIPYCVSLIMVTITSHIFINIFQTVHFPAVKFTRGNEKNTSFLLIPKSPKLWGKSEVIGPGTFKQNNRVILYCIPIKTVHSVTSVHTTLQVYTWKICNKWKQQIALYITSIIANLGLFTCSRRWYFKFHPRDQVRFAKIGKYR